MVNAPPGCGKTTLFTHDIPAWLTCRKEPSRNDGSGHHRGWPAATPTGCEGRWLGPCPRKPATTTSPADWRWTPRPLWPPTSAGSRRWETAGRPTPSWSNRLTGTITEKEATWSAYGQDAGFIGGRFDFVVWDDLVDPKKQKTIEAKEDLQNYWDDVSEPRLEPEGLLILQGQRFASDDLYRTASTKRWATTSTSTPGS